MGCNGQPFNLIHAPALPVTVSKVRKAVWVGKRDPHHPGREGLGRLCDEEPRLVGPAEWWDDNYDPRPYYPIYESEPWEGFNWCTTKFELRRKCDRILVAQNCKVEEVEVDGDTGVQLTIPDNFQWFAPRTGRYTGDFTRPESGEEAVRPWSGPCGDIADWSAEEPYASFLPFTWKFSPGEGDWDRGHGNLLNIAAKELFEAGEAPSAWGLTGMPLFRVQYKNTGLDDPPYSSFGDVADAKDYILDPGGWPSGGVIPFKVLYWAKIQEVAILRELREWMTAPKTANDFNALSNRLAVPTDGTAFDLMLYTVAYNEREMQCEPALGGEGDRWETLEETGIGRWWRGVARIVKSLPPAEGGA